MLGGLEVWRFEGGFVYDVNGRITGGYSHFIETHVWWEIIWGSCNGLDSLQNEKQNNLLKRTVSQTHKISPEIKLTLHSSFALLGEDIFAFYHSSSQATSKTRNNSPAKTALSSICIGSKSTKYSTMRPNNTKAPSFVLKFLTPSHQGEVVGIVRKNRVLCEIYATKFYHSRIIWFGKMASPASIMAPCLVKFQRVWIILSDARCFLDASQWFACKGLVLGFPPAQELGWPFCQNCIALSQNCIALLQKCNALFPNCNALLAEVHCTFDVFHCTFVKLQRAFAKLQRTLGKTACETAMRW